ncbi:ankyrin repeat domain-containing protein [Methylocapsa palsarum]|uniref:Thiosulfate/3-mercaptopyruvate sulfurtransferase n=1 Tax=Methylocapsa palsarum TaxID=1612308 RepID=A0A1I3W2V4_9HYPH|nr:ankyrin repeat domain-containing protein [Methylocapsa palsarum]SFK01669.1 thiosulfate/3-mercaptopyruvate sulfurtransferase [Methylocapsa palsarum]
MTQSPVFCRVSAEETANLIGEGVLLLDVRDAESFARSHIETAMNLSIANLENFVTSTAKRRPVLIYCHRGYASEEFARLFCENGFERVYSLEGGYLAWGKQQSARTPLPGQLQTWLIRHGFPAARIDAVAANGVTPLMMASQAGNLKIVRALIAAGAALDARNDDGNTALWLACYSGRTDVVDALADAGSAIDNRNENGATAVMYAASSGKAAVLERLIVAGADLTIETLDGFTVTDMAATLECLTLLRRAAAKNSSRPEPSTSAKVRQLNF